MATSNVKRNARRAAVAGAVGAAALSAMLVPATASAAPVKIPNVGTYDVPDNILHQIPPNIAAAIPPGILPAIPGVTPPAPETTGQRVANAALSRVGDPYVWGATGPNAFDCSGLVQWSYGQAGVNVPRTSYAQEGAGTPVSLNALQPGDVVSYYGGSHSAIYVGNGNVVHAPDSGEDVQVVSLNSMPADSATRL